MRFFLVYTMLVIFAATSSVAKSDVYFCNSTDAILIDFHLQNGSIPIYVQKVNPHISTFKFKREKKLILIKQSYEVSLPIIDTSWRRPTGVSDHFVARDDVSNFSFSDGLVVYDMGGTILTANCDKF